MEHTQQRWVIYTGYA